MALSAQTPALRPATLKDFLAIPAYDRFHEILEGELVRKTVPSGHHGLVQGRLRALLGGYDDGSPRRQPGGWWLITEAEIMLPWEQPVRPDLTGWRCERMPEVPDEFPIRLLPDWVCEVVSPSDRRRDTVVKYRDYARAGIPYYWLVDLKQRSLTALQLKDGHYVVQAEALQGRPLQVEPFSLVEIAIEVLFRGVPHDKDRAPTEPEPPRTGEPR
jgi:Uma2 family endonuclease